MTHKQEPSALGRIVELVRDLRQRCSWDRVQTRETLRPYLVEEVLELDHAISEASPEQIKIELGDLLLHLAFQIVIGEERGEFGAEDVTKTIESKMHRRHPHLFDLGEEPESWERQKLKEQKGVSGSLLDGLPPSLPPLLTAYRLQERAAGVGFDWPDTEGPRKKIDEELKELDEESQNPLDRDRAMEEVGDVLFSVVNLARKLGLDPRTALEKANRRFAERFRRVEQLAAQKNIDMTGSNLDALDALWNEAKKEIQG
ncbi:MAG: nucleoside triphosphate pyrophosphohydrolase [Gemmatimonadota bacterium]|nr:nucleoside triphosphate pyrophosphohydrolase [Gemmatimonadota bacterium]